ncbi:MAG: 5-(carboxyamino)imidazole ribonucleotide synthase [Cohaesibacteraceae bacterium]
MEPLRPGDTIGVLGGGQLGRMLAMAAADLGLRTHIYAPEANQPAAEVAAFSTVADYTDTTPLDAFAGRCQVVTFEFENIPTASLERLAGVVPLRPGLKSLEVSQDRLVEKQFIETLGVKVAPFAPIDGPDDLAQAHAALGSDTILKTRRFGYDGKGQVSLRSGDVLRATEIWQTVGAVPAVLEARIPFVAEISCLLVRDADGTIAAYDVPHNVHQRGILHTSSVGSLAAFRPTPAIASAARSVTQKIAKALGHIGLLTVEFFVTEAGDLLVNEIAPRVHNSGHWTMDACLNSQFDNHIRAVAGWPLATTERHSDAQMHNLLGEDMNGPDAGLDQPEWKRHLYGKVDARPGRKMGHRTRLVPKEANP